MARWWVAGGEWWAPPRGLAQGARAVGGVAGDALWMHRGAAGREDNWAPKGLKVLHLVVLMIV